MAYRKDWNAIARELSSPEDSDEGDSLNVMSVQRNAHRVAEMLHGMIPGLDPDRMRTPPAGMNSVGVIREGLASATRVASHHSREPHPLAPSGAEEEAPMMPPAPPVSPTPPTPATPAPPPRAEEEAEGEAGVLV